MTYKTEFPDYDRSALPAVYGLRDESWHNDACPVLRNDRFELWLDYIDPAKREFDDTAMFTLTRLLPEGTTGDALASDSFAEIMRAYITATLAPMDDANRRAWLGAAYTHTVGYNPFEDDDTATVNSVSEMLADVLDAHVADAD